MDSDLQQLEARLGEVAAEHRGAASGAEDLARRKAEAARLVDEQEEKLSRAQKQAGKMLSKAPGGTVEVDLADARDSCRAMLAELAALAVGVPGLASRAEVAGLRLTTGGVANIGGGGGGSLTPPPGSRAGSRAGSFRG